MARGSYFVFKKAILRSVLVNGNNYINMSKNKFPRPISKLYRESLCDQFFIHLWSLRKLTFPLNLKRWKTRTQRWLQKVYKSPAAWSWPGKRRKSQSVEAAERRRKFIRRGRSQRCIRWIWPVRWRRSIISKRQGMIMLQT